jgi:hypothetical protein
MKKFNSRVFILATFIVMILTLICWTGIVEDEVKKGTIMFWHTLAGIWPIFRFPLITFFGGFLFVGQRFAYVPLLTFLNCAFYGLIIERTFYLFRKKPKSHPLGIRVTDTKKPD